jgi:hypothetical protein
MPNPWHLSEVLHQQQRWLVFAWRTRDTMARAVEALSALVHYIRSALHSQRNLPGIFGRFGTVLNTYDD